MNNHPVYHRAIMPVFIVLMVFAMFSCCVATPAESVEPEPTPLSERQLLLNKRLDFVKQRRQIESDIAVLQTNINRLKNQPDAQPVLPSHDIRTPVSLTRATWWLVFINFIILGIIMLIRHKQQEPRP